MEVYKRPFFGRLSHSTSPENRIQTLKEGEQDEKKQVDNMRKVMR